MTAKCILSHCIQLQHNFLFLSLYTMQNHTLCAVLHVPRVMMFFSFHHLSCPHEPSLTCLPFAQSKFLYFFYVPIHVIDQHPLIREGPNFLNKTSKSQEIKSRINKCDFLKLKSFSAKYYSALKENRITAFASKWMKLENIMQTEVSQFQK